MAVAQNKNKNTLKRLLLFYFFKAKIEKERSGLFNGVLTASQPCRSYAGGARKEGRTTVNRL